MIMAQQWHMGGMKRRREPDDEDVVEGFGQHRSKKHMPSLPFRSSPPSPGQNRPSLLRVNPTIEPTFPATAQADTITPIDSDPEDIPSFPEPINTHTSGPKTIFSAWSSSPSSTVVQSSQPSPSPIYHSDDLDMMDISTSDSFNSDTPHLAPGPFQPDQLSPLPNTLSARIPTPIHAQFFRPGTNIPNRLNLNNMQGGQDAHLGLINTRDHRRLPSPISEGENSPSVLLSEGVSDMQMDSPSYSSYSSHVQRQQQDYAYSSMVVQTPPSYQEGMPDENCMETEPVTVPTVQITSPPKKNHARGRHSMRRWDSEMDTAATGSWSGKKSFSMGYRADCEKCRLRVPGHFSHILTA